MDEKQATLDGFVEDAAPAIPLSELDRQGRTDQLRG